MNLSCIYGTVSLEPAFVYYYLKSRSRGSMLLTEFGLTDVDQHVCIGAVAY